MQAGSRQLVRTARRTWLTDGSPCLAFIGWGVAFIGWGVASRAT